MQKSKSYVGYTKAYLRWERGYCSILIMINREQSLLLRTSIRTNSGTRLEYTYTTTLWKLLRSAFEYAYSSHFE